MWRYILRRLVGLVGVLVFIGTVVFFLVHLIPGSPAQVILGPDATPAQVARLTKQLGLDRPIYIQFFHWFNDLLHGDLGYSVFYERSLAPLIADHLVPSLTLTLLTTALSIVVAVPVALASARRRGGAIDRLLTPVSVLGFAIPQFWLALMLILVVGVRLRLLPVSGYVDLGAGIGPWLSHLTLPVLCLAPFQIALFVRILRDGISSELSKPYIRGVRSKGASERQVLLNHALPNAALPTVTVIGTSLATILGGVIIIENIFAIPGMGQLMLQAILNRDYTSVEAATLMIAVIYVLANLVVDLLSLVLDPRLRAE